MVASRQRAALRVFLAFGFLTWFSAQASVRAQTSGLPASPLHTGHDDATVPVIATRDGSGTSWQPMVTPMQGFHVTRGPWTAMLHGNVFGQFIYEPGERHRTGGASTRQVSSTGWWMAMARRQAGRGRVGLRTMWTLEPWTVGSCGYLNLLATGEVCEGDTIHDRQHPHDFVMELAADYDRPLRGALRWQTYAALSGEPALGPGGFPHRLSAIVNPAAPISHHWLDATHISFGVVTSGLYTSRWKAEASLFNGREPDAARAGLELGRLDSVAARLSLLPSPHLSVQVSAGHLNEAEAEPGRRERADRTRATASATYHRPFSAHGLWATTLAYGLNAGRIAIPGGSFHAVSHAVLLESSVTADRGDVWFGRAEVVGKPAHDLHAHEFPTRIFTVGKLQVGYVRQIGRWNGVASGVGGSVAANLLPPALASRYGGRVTPGFGIFVSVRPATHAAMSMLGDQRSPQPAPVGRSRTAEATARPSP